LTFLTLLPAVRRGGLHQGISIMATTTPDQMSLEELTASVRAIADQLPDGHPALAMLHNIFAAFPTPTCDNRKRALAAWFHRWHEEPSRPTWRPLLPPVPMGYLVKGHGYNGLPSYMCVIYVLFLDAAQRELKNLFLCGWDKVEIIPDTESLDADTLGNGGAA
jgi:hypothetical protein